MFKYNLGILSYLLLASCATVVCMQLCADYLDEDGYVQDWSDSVHDQLVLE